MARPDLEMVNDRMKLMMDRLIARRISRDPELVRRAHQDLLEDRNAAGADAQWWMDEWLEVLEKGNDHVRQFICSRSEYARQMANASPLYSMNAVGDMFHDLALRRRILNKARQGLILLEERREAQEYLDDARTANYR